MYGKSCIELTLIFNFVNFDQEWTNIVQKDR